MFTTVKSARTAALAALTALSVAAVPAAPALAMGDKEKGFVAGALTAVIVDELLKQGRQAREHRREPVYGAPPVYAPAPVYNPAPVYAPAPVATTSIHATPVARAFNTYSLRERQAIQRSLRASGYYSGAIDGSFGPRTYNAVVAYARDAGARNNLQTTGGAFAIYDGLIF
ncbi:peptidoglycan-binding domain-containing protein [Pseudogemmobacter blasticus]|uniref:Antifreeze protein n=1 Tax=Fuscovulum blasticum DSM 2131 TaxID=1188250 RepID=A0A2T4J7T6_FUSBL|nr:peptidoglycan-binding domain-containing protein [Fuscovulum blasticum]PTE13965.1 antifreeze protein [Fuscovulum blasticum DSM 2131]